VTNKFEIILGIDTLINPQPISISVSIALLASSHSGSQRLAFPETPV